MVLFTSNNSLSHPHNVKYVECSYYEKFYNNVPESECQVDKSTNH